MKIIPPIRVTDSILTSSTVTENDAPLWESNLLTNESAFDDAAWVKTSATVAANTDSDPDGQTRADTLTATAANGQVAQSYTAAARPYIKSVWIRRKVGTGAVQISADGTTFQTVTLPANGSWQRFDTTITPAAGTRSVVIRLAVAGDSVAIYKANLKTRSYAIGERVMRQAIHRVFRRLTTGTSDDPPESDPVNWADAGPTNRWAMFDYDSNTATTQASGTLTVRLALPSRVSALALFGITAHTARVIMRVDGSPVYDRTISLSNRPVSSWVQFFFEGFSFRRSVVLMDLPLFLNAELEVQISRNGAGAVALETLAFGLPVDIGTTQLGAESDILDFSRVVRDADGNATLERRKNVPRLRVRVRVPKGGIPGLSQLRQQFAAQPLVFLAVEDSADEYFDALAMVGIFRRMPILADLPTYTIVELEAEGL